MQNKEKLAESIRKTCKILNKICKFNRKLLFLIPVGILIYIFAEVRDNSTFLLDVVLQFYSHKFSYQALDSLHKFIYIKTGIYGLFFTRVLEFSYELVIYILLFNRLYRLLNYLQDSDSPFNIKLAEHIRSIVLLLVAVNISRPVAAIFCFIAGYCLLKVFEYGICLQQESDETV